MTGNVDESFMVSRTDPELKHDMISILCSISCVGASCSEENIYNDLLLAFSSCVEREEGRKVFLNHDGPLFVHQIIESAPASPTARDFFPQMLQSFFDSDKSTRMLFLIFSFIHRLRKLTRG